MKTRSPLGFSIIEILGLISLVVAVTGIIVEIAVSAGLLGLGAVVGAVLFGAGLLNQ